MPLPHVPPFSRAFAAVAVALSTVITLIGPVNADQTSSEIAAPVNHSAVSDGRTAKPLMYYRLRLELTSDASWAEAVALDWAPAILTTRLVSVTGTPNQLRSDFDRLRVQQTNSASLAGTQVGAVVDYALSPSALQRPLRFLLHKSPLNSTTVRVWAVTPTGRFLIREVHHRGWVPGNTDLNPLEFTVDLKSFMNSYYVYSFPDLSPPKMVWAFYYPWYNRLHWSSDVLADTPLHPYASFDGSSISRQIDEALSAGVDGFISSWWGPGNYTDDNFRLLLDAASKREFSVAIHLEILDGDTGLPRDTTAIADWISYVIREYGNHPSYAKVGGKPVIVVWATNVWPLRTWAAIFADVRARGLDAFFLPNGFEHEYLDVFDGISRYDVVKYENLASTYAEAGQHARLHSLLTDAKSPKLWAATVQPGYDDRRLPGRNGFVRERGSGAYYRSTIDAAVASDPDWVFISTWNEWWEHTHIEPSVSFENEYLDLTREFTAQWKDAERQYGRRAWAAKA
jgi:hypothetical protein